MGSAFDDVRVLDFSQGVAGPMATMYLADFGAEVFKLEPPDGDRMAAHPGYHAWNRNKQVSTLDLETDRERALDLIAGADVVVFDHAPGELERLGLDGPSLTAAFPALIHLWTPPYGVTGALSRLPPDHALLTAVTGAAFRQTTYGDQPAYIVSPQGWYAQAATAAASAAAALYERAKSGRGQAVTVSGLNGVAQANGPTTFYGAMEGTGVGLPHGTGPNYRCYRCADGRWLFFGALFPPMRLRALEAIGLADLLHAPGIDGNWANVGLPEGYAVATYVLERRFAERPRDAWLELLLAADVPCAPVEDRETWFAGPTVAQDGMRVELPHAELGKVAIPGVPVRLSATPGVIRALARPAAPEPRAARPTPVDEPPRGQPLAGVRVLDLGTVIAGAYTGCMLASLGAEVIKIEPAEGDPFRLYGALFLAYNRGKRSLAIDLKHPQGREAFLDLVRGCDVVTDNARPGVRARLGLDYEALKAVNPRIVSCSISAYAHDGDRAHRPGFDPLLQAEAGFMAAQGGDGEPVYHQIAINDVASTVTAVFGILAALNVRERTGEGQEVTTSLGHQSVMFQSGEVVWYEGRRASLVGGTDFLGPSAGRRFYNCSDGWIAIACQSRADEAALAQVLELSALSTEAAEIAFALLSRGEALARLAGAGVAAVPALRSFETYGERWLWENGFFEGYHHPLVGQVIGPPGFARWSRSQARYERAAPELAEHSIEVLLDFGLSEDRIRALLESGAVVQA